MVANYTHISLTLFIQTQKQWPFPKAGFKTHATHLIVFCTVSEDQAHIRHKLLDGLVVLQTL